ncbi:MAG: ChaN family lipoprotein [Bacteroidales bacterium]|nr:ChaN family lipoprotein [Bacteroidales bacterium]
MKSISLIAILLFISYGLYAQKQAYKIYKSNGEETSYNEMLNTSSESDVVLFGELHNNPVCHWLQLEMTVDLYEMKGQNLSLGAEMLERDNQLMLEEYLQGKIATTTFENQARLWPNYETDYKPLVEFAKENKIEFVATNIPRRYASIIADHGFEGLDSVRNEAFRWIAPLPMPYDPDLPGYKQMTRMMGMHREPNLNLPKAQAARDATMAHFILKHKEKEGVFLHFNGTYHSNNYEGINWYLKKYKPNVEITTIATTEQENLDKLEEDSRNLADFILVIPSRMTKTY